MIVTTFGGFVGSGVPALTIPTGSVAAAMGAIVAAVFALSVLVIVWRRVS